MVSFKNFILVEQDGGMAIDLTPLELSGPQKSGEDVITGKHETAKVLHYSFSLPAGYTCPYATECRSRTVGSGKVHRGNQVGTVVDGPLCKFRCFAASNEGIYADARAVRNRNMEKLTGIHPDKHFPDDEVRDKYNINKGTEFDQLDAAFRNDEAELGDSLNDISHTIHDQSHIKKLIVETIQRYKTRIIKTGPKYNGGGVIRVHVSGDFYSQAYFNAWMEAAAEFQPNGNFPGITFYAYTKSIPYWIKAKNAGIIPENFKLNASYGGSKDSMIDENLLKFAKVCFSKEEAENYAFKYIDRNGNLVEKVGLLICEEDDAPAYESDEPFALLLHGTQPKGSEAADSIEKIKNDIKDEKLAERIGYFVDQGDTPLHAHFKVEIYLTANSNVDDARKGQTKAINGRIVKTVNKIAVLLYRNDNGLAPDAPIKDAVKLKAYKQYKAQATDIFKEIYPDAMAWAKKKHKVEDRTDF